MAGHLVERIPLSKNPAVETPQPVTLPFSYTSVPASEDKIALTPAVDTGALEAHIDTMLKSMDEAREQHSAKWNGFLRSCRSKYHERAVRVAPGYLDTNQHILTPTPAAAQTAPEAENSIDRAFSHLK